MIQKHADYIIVGQGLAGTMLSHFLTEAGKTVLIIDQPNPSSSSNIAAGIIHPITGRRLVKSWLFDEANHFSRQTYSAFSESFSEHFFNDLPIVEIYSSVKNRNDWIQRSSNPGYENLIGDELPANFDQAINAPFGAIKLNATGFLKIKSLLDAYRNYLMNSRQIINETFEFESLVVTDTRVEYKSYTADKIIFCEGFNAYKNPLFDYLPYRLVKGEVIIVKCDHLRNDFIINKSIYIQPLGDDRFRVGSTYDWDHLDEKPTPLAEKKLKDQFATIVSLPFTIEKHMAGVRPTMKHRRPVIGMHPTRRRVGIFNGLGTKGVLLAPYLAHHFVCNLTSGSDLMKEVRIENYGI